MGRIDASGDHLARGQEQESPWPSSASASMSDVHSAWLAAASRGDVAAMRQLKNEFPEWLELHKVLAGSAEGQPSNGQEFRLRTIGASALHTAAWGGHTGVMQYLLESGQGPDAGDEGGTTPVMVAIHRFNVTTMRCVFRDGVREALRRNLVVDCREEDAQTLQAVTAVAKLLLRFGGQIDARNLDGKTALHYATSDDAYEIAKFLLDSGASADSQDQYGKTPLHYCVEEGGLLVTNLLLSHCANLDLQDAGGTTALMLMVRRANFNVLQLFLNHHQWVATPQRLDFGGAILLLAVDYKLESVARFVVENDYTSVTARNARGETPMHRAILQRDPSMMELLSDLDSEGEALTAVTISHETPSHYAAFHGTCRVVETLLRCLMRSFGDLQELPELGVENPLNVVNAEGMTSLYVVGVARSFRDRESDQQDESGFACRIDRDEKAQLLVDHGAQLFPPDVLAQKLAPAASGSTSWLVLPAQVQHCLSVWLVERESRSTGSAQPDTEQTRVDALTEVCFQWTIRAARLGSSATLLAIVVSAGYIHQVLPLLLSLPLRRRDFPAFLHQLDQLARHQRTHILLQQLHRELTAAWNEVVELTVGVGS